MFARAASVNRASMLAASFASSLIGFVSSLQTVGVGHRTSELTTAAPPELSEALSGVKPDVAINSTLTDKWVVTFYTSLASSIVSLLVVIVSCAPAALCRRGDEGRWYQQVNFQWCGWKRTNKTRGTAVRTLTEPLVDLVEADIHSSSLRATEVCTRRKCSWLWRVEASPHAARSTPSTEEVRPNTPH